MNGRFALLLVTCTLFAAAWRADGTGRRTDTRVAYRSHVSPVLYAHVESPHEATETVVRVENVRRAKELVSAPSVDPTPGGIGDIEVVGVEAAGEPEAVEVVEEVRLHAALPLPVDIAAGEYRAVSNRGEVREITLTTDDLAAYGVPTVIERRASYVLEVDGVAWYFIRIEPRTARVEPAEERASIEPTNAGRWMQSVVGAVRSLDRALTRRAAALVDDIAGTMGRSSRRMVGDFLGTIGRARTAMFPAGETSRQ